MPISHLVCLSFSYWFVSTLCTLRLLMFCLPYMWQTLISLDPGPLWKARQICFYCPSGCSVCFCSDESSLQAIFYWQCFSKQKWIPWGLINLSLPQTHTWRTPHLSMAKSSDLGISSPSFVPQFCSPLQCLSFCFLWVERVWLIKPGPWPVGQTHFPIQPCTPLLVDQKWQIENNGWHHSARGADKRGPLALMAGNVCAPSTHWAKIRKKPLATWAYLSHLLFNIRAHGFPVPQFCRL